MSFMEEKKGREESQSDCPFIKISKKMFKTNKNKVLFPLKFYIKITSKS